MTKAWRITWTGIPEETGIYAAESRGEALGKAARALAELGYPATWTDLRCTRAKEWDSWAVANAERVTGVNEEYLRRETGVVG